MKRLLLSTVSLLLLTACATTSTPMDPVAEVPAEVPADVPPPVETASGPTPQEAKAFVEGAEVKLADLSEYQNHAAWAAETYIIHDTEWVRTKSDAAMTEAMVGYATDTARFNGVNADAATRRKLDLLRVYQPLPAANTPGAAEAVAGVSARLQSTYSTGKFTWKGKTYNLTEASNLMATSRDPATLRAMWEGWMSIATPMRSDYAKLAQLSNDGAKGLGFDDTGALWRSGYDMSPDAFAAETDRLYAQVKPFYVNLHCYVRRKLNEKYGDGVQPKFGPIRADLLGNMWAQDWTNIYDVVAPKTIKTSYSLDKLLVAKKYDAVKMVKTGENFYTSIGLEALPQTFWERSQITRPRDREVVCHASAWDIDNRDDIRVKMCTQVNGEDFYTVHHELGHNYYQRAYKEQPFLFKNGANDGFHEAIGDFIGLSSVTPTYLNQIGLLDKVPDSSEDIPFLLKMSLQKVAFLPFGLMIDRWRWEVYNGEITEAEYNARWWQLIGKYQGLAAPGVRPSTAFDPGAKYHIPAGVPYTRYFLADILQFQFQRAACDEIGWKGPLHRCSIYGERAVGAKLNAMLEMGQSKPWPEALEAFTGQREMDATAIIEYFKPLDAWLTEQNKGEKCGWET
ncbi:peptidyl-dipeptidase A [Asticcacaulis sp. AC460]|uniref:M2 family metallopeptidase n=1 Tax=Asticcacaulis sp. AC460 TaxID=1282360 RepID=UPI0003C3C73E|nr:M2 family metallopeptidase [Asticcacaulis sp. AC460]ESQ92710.1 peptidyl-dipeptidase A [Asticcacaulis sp. AC460]